MRKNRIAAGFSFLLIASLVFFLMGSFQPKKDYKIKPLNLTAVNFQDNFWQKRIETDLKVTIPHDFKQEEATGRIKNFEIASPQGSGNFCSNYPFDDSDVYRRLKPLLML